MPPDSTTLAGMNVTLLDETITRLTPAEKLALIGKIWATLDAEALPVPPEVAAELDRRWAEHQLNPGAAFTLDELMARVAAKRR
jgi:putative addiction module component (TIGR02574 family)